MGICEQCKNYIDTCLALKQGKTVTSQGYGCSSYIKLGHGCNRNSLIDYCLSLFPKEERSNDKLDS